MTRNINLNSSDWCNLIFDGKNKEYGAYEMRLTSSKRHVWAFVVTLMVVSLFVFVPQLINAVTTVETDDGLTGYGGTIELMNMKDKAEKKIEEPIVIEPQMSSPPPPLIRTESFTPPVITNDDDVVSEREMRDQLDLLESTGVISVYNHETDNTEGVDPADVLREHWDIAGTGDGSGNGTGTGDGILESVEVMPDFPGGRRELMKFLQKNLKYPAMAAENGIEGRVIVRFVVSKTGAISNAQVIKGFDPACDNEAVRVVNEMPNWIPGSQNGQSVAVYFTLPVHFKLNK
ncbi:energy transducer TonB [Dysgonomonas sp. 216]|uniref:energy transducer TonB n=1 Tax=Dysgonomonas sp. 216 TaxID=2302934 RepID=UPI0013D13EBE|nr:energy transducer TonB [Dysgonomonas sp. 216]NDW19487.1 energy transducer TonB [Dysgonomonas sp. 216]